MPLSVITHKGKKILIVDFTACTTQEEMLAQMDENRAFYESNTEHWLVLNDLTGLSGSQEFIDKVERYAAEIFNTRTIKSAVIGVHGVSLTLLEAHNRTSPVKRVPFTSREEALDYLVE